MYKIATYNNIAPVGLEYLKSFQVDEAQKGSEGIVLRSHKLQETEIDEAVLGIARAGAGVNNIPLEYCTEKGVIVFNTPGANANAVKELVIAGLLMSSRRIHESMNAIAAEADAENLSAIAEKLKKDFIGPEIRGKTLGIVGLGAIGVMVAQAAVALDMQVVGYDPYLSVANALALPIDVEHTENMDVLLSKSDYITVHVPYNKATHELITSEEIAKMKPGVRLLNFARKEILKTEDVVKAVEGGKVARFVTDFADKTVINKENILVLPHLGASTPEAEENCAMMACKQLRKFLNHGSIINSVNFPYVDAGPVQNVRLTVIHQNIPKMISQITELLSDQNINIADLINKSRDSVAYTVIDMDSDIDESILKAVNEIEGVIRTRLIKA